MLLLLYPIAAAKIIQAFQIDIRALNIYTSRTVLNLELGTTMDWFATVYFLYHILIMYTGLVSLGGYVAGLNLYCRYDTHKLNLLL